MKMTGKAAQLIVVGILEDLEINVEVDDEDFVIEITDLVEDMLIIHNVILDSDIVDNYSATYFGQRFIVDWIDVHIDSISTRVNKGVARLSF